MRARPLGPVRRQGAQHGQGITRFKCR